jgi:hypothetical protein
MFLLFIVLNSSYLRLNYFAFGPALLKVYPYTKATDECIKGRYVLMVQLSGYDLEMYHQRIGTRHQVSHEPCKSPVSSVGSRSFPKIKV